MAELGGERQGFIPGYTILESVIFILYIYSKYILIFFNDIVFNTLNKYGRMQIIRKNYREEYLILCL